MLGRLSSAGSASPPTPASDQVSRDTQDPAVGGHPDSRMDPRGVSIGLGRDMRGSPPFRGVTLPPEGGRAAANESWCPCGFHPLFPEARGRSRSLRRTFSPSIWTTWQWCSRRSRMAVARASFRTSPATQQAFLGGCRSGVRSAGDGDPVPDPDSNPDMAVDVVATVSPPTRHPRAYATTRDLNSSGHRQSLPISPNPLPASSPARRSASRSGASPSIPQHCTTTPPPTTRARARIYDVVTDRAAAMVTAAGTVTDPGREPGHRSRPPSADAAAEPVPVPAPVRDPEPVRALRPGIARRISCSPTRLDLQTPRLGGWYRLAQVPNSTLGTVPVLARSPLLSTVYPREALPGAWRRRRRRGSGCWLARRGY